MPGPGPPYPHPNPVPGSNAIGLFTIGISPIGTIPPFDLWRTVISQYANSPILTALIQSFNDAVDQTENLDDLYDMIWNVLTAQSYGLDVWGRIVGVSRVLQIPNAATSFLGFVETGDPTHDVGFGQAPFFTGGEATTNFLLTDTDFRRLILAKAASNICDGSIPATNAILLALFPNRGACYVTDGQNMTMTYTFQFALSVLEVAMLQQNPSLLPRPTGVAATVVQI